MMLASLKRVRLAVSVATENNFLSVAIQKLPSDACITMAPLYALLSFLGLLTSFVSATALTYKLPPNGKECFYSHIEQKGAKVAFYFAVST